MAQTDKAYKVITEVDEGLRGEAVSSAQSQAPTSQWARWARGELGDFMTTSELDEVDWGRLRELLK